MHRIDRLFAAIILFVCSSSWSFAERPAIAIIIDDLGNNLEAGKRVINSDWPIACSILPARTFSKEIAELAHLEGKEVLVHMPMQAKDKRNFGQGELTVNMTNRDFTLTVNTNIDSVPYARGVNNHMGSLLTQFEDYMDLFMQTLANRDEYLYFIDSRTTASTVARAIANEYHIPNLERDVFLDSVVNDREHVRKQLKRLVQTANVQGYALAIGHPYETTLSVLNQELPNLHQKNIKLVHVSKLIEIARAKQWQLSLSPSHKVAKN